MSGDVVAFKGIPFARAPVGDRRWKAPTPPEQWAGIRAATEFGPACRQAGDVRKSEDCLYLNVWAPASALTDTGRRAPLPVLVWTFGGSFTSGSGNIDGRALARRGVVVVSFNYRVGTFGFLAHPQLSGESPDHVSGNYGLLDAIQALRWIRDNIAPFGGDRSRVTMWGVSAGASLITALMVAPRADGLFQRAILDSPGAMRHWTPLRESEERGARLGDIGALRQLPASEVPLLQNLGGSRGVRPLFAPGVVGLTLDGVLLKEEEREAFEAGRVSKVEVLVGNVADEGAVFTAAYPVKSVDAYREYMRGPAIFGPLGDEALGLYPAASDADVAGAIADSFGDSQFTFGARGIARAMSLVGPHVWRYLFIRPANGGAGHAPWHGAQVRYAAGSVDGPEYNGDDKALSDLMMDAWVRFAMTGSPNGSAIGNWPPYDAKSDPLMILDVRPAVAFGLRNAQLDFIGRVQRATRR